MKTSACQLKASKNYYEKNKEIVNAKIAQKYHNVSLPREFVKKIKQQAKKQNMSLIQLIMSKFQ
jgi:hypothetical protein